MPCGKLRHAGPAKRALGLFPAMLCAARFEPAAVPVQMLPTTILPPRQTCYNGAITIV